VEVVVPEAAMAATHPAEAASTLAWASAKTVATAAAFLTVH